MGKKKKNDESDEINISSEPIIESIKQEKIIENPIFLVKTPEQMFREEFNRAKNFQIYHGNIVIFDSEFGKKDKVIFISNGFQIFNKIYSYNGIRLKTK